MPFEVSIDRCLICTTQDPFHISEFFAGALSAVNGRRVTVATGAQHHEILFSPVFGMLATAIDVVHISSGGAYSLQEVTEDTPAIITGFRQSILTFAMRDQFVLPFAFGFDPIGPLRLWLWIEGHDRAGMYLRMPGMQS